MNMENELLRIPIFKTVLEVLNEACEADSTAISELITDRVDCNQKLADHPTIQVQDTGIQTTNFEVGVLGLINGIVEKITGRRVAVILDLQCSKCKAKGKDLPPDAKIRTTCPLCQQTLIDHAVTKFIEYKIPEEIPEEIPEQK